MTYQNRNRGSYQEEGASYQSPPNTRYPGSFSDDEFSQFGGQSRGGPREWGGGESGWGQSQQGGYQGSTQRGGYQGGYQGGGYQGGGSQWGYQGGNQGGGYPGSSQNYQGGAGYQSRSYGNDEYGSQSRGYGQENYGAQRGESPRSQPSGYPDYSTPQRSWGAESQGGYGYRGQSRDFGNSQQERGGMDSGPSQNYRGGTSNYGSPSYAGGSMGGSQYGSSSYGSSGQGGTLSDWGSSETQQQQRRNGPKGYQRSDERLREQVVERLMDTNIDLQDIECDVKDGVVTLSGTVDSRRCRHHLENVADSIWGVKDVNNNVRVRQSSQSGGAVEGKPGSERSTSATGSGGSSSSSYIQRDTSTAGQQNKNR